MIINKTILQFQLLNFCIIFILILLLFIFLPLIILFFTLFILFDKTLILLLHMPHKRITPS